MTDQNQDPSNLLSRPLSIESDVVLEPEEAQWLEEARRSIAQIFGGQIWSARVSSNNRFPERIFQIAFRFEVKSAQKYREVLNKSLIKQDEGFS